MVKTFINDLLDRARNLASSDKAKAKSEKSKALFAVGVVCILWGTTWLASKIGVKHMPALQLSGLRHFIGGAIYVVFFIIKKIPFPTKKQFIRILWMSVVMFVISNGFSVLSIVYIPSGLGAVIGAMTPLWLVIFSLMTVRGTIFNTMTLVGIILGFGGIIVVFYDYLEEMTGSDFPLGIFFGVIASMTWAIGTLLTAKHSKDMDPYVSLGWQMMISGIILTCLSYATGQHRDVLTIAPEGWYSILYLVLVGSIIAFTAFVYALKRLPAAQVSVHSYINPIVAILIGYSMQGEKLTSFVILGTLVTLLGVYLVNTGFKRNVTTEKN
jgi:drug/metabolite transporter (DMT)-like permease